MGKLVLSPELLKIGLALPGEGTGYGLSGGDIYSTLSSNLPNELKRKDVQKELLFMMRFLWLH